MKVSRERANARERNRQKSIGNAFTTLRNHLPKFLRDRKPSKAETLKSAAQYISHLLRILDNGMQTNAVDEYQKRVITEMAYQKGIWTPPAN